MYVFYNFPSLASLIEFLPVCIFKILGGLCHAEAMTKLAVALVSFGVAKAGYQILDWNTIQDMVLKWNRTFQGFDLVN